VLDIVASNWVKDNDANGCSLHTSMRVAGRYYETSQQARLFRPMACMRDGFARECDTETKCITICSFGKVIMRTPNLS